MISKVIIDVQDQKLETSMLSILNSQIKNIQYISYQDSQESTFIFKELNTLSELKKFSLKKYPLHSIVIITDNQELMFLALDLYPLSFIRKAHLNKDLSKTISLIMDINKNIEQILTFKMGYSYIQIKTNQILWIESFGHYLFIHTKTGQYKVREQITTLLEKVDSKKFIRVHKSYIVNTDFILQTSANEIELITHEFIPIGRKFKQK